METHNNAANTKDFQFDKNKFISMLGFCKKAGKLALGYDTSKQKIQSKEACLMITSGDISPKTLKEVIFICDNNNIKHICANITMDEVSQMVRKKAGVLCILDKGFAKALCDLTNNSYEEECR